MIKIGILIVVWVTLSVLGAITIPNMLWENLKRRRD